jgi:two-component system sensor histidine kinase UhpB
MSRHVVDFEKADSRSLPPGISLWHVALIVLVGAGCYLAQYASLALWGGSVVAPLWLPGGLVLGALAVLPKSVHGRFLVLASIATACVGLPEGWNVSAAALVMLAAFSLTAYFANHWRASREEIAGFVGLRSFTWHAWLIAAVVATPAALVRWNGHYQDFAEVWIVAAFAIALGYLVMAPPIMVLVGNASPGRLGRRRVLAGLLALLGIALLSSILWTMLSRWYELRLPISVVPMAFLFWAAARFGMRGACASILAISLALVIFTLLAPIAVAPSLADSFSLQVWLLMVVSATYVIGVFADERNRLSRESEAGHEQALDLAGRLIDVQEAERARISRELHDDISQKLASLCIATSALKRMSEGEMRAGFGKLRDQLVCLSGDVRRLSHDLHPDVIRHAGVVCALRSLCLEQHSTDGGSLELDMDQNLQIPGQVSLCLYRVAQEALHNASKHANHRTMRLTLHRSGDSVELTIADDGSGFFPDSPRARRHLGLVSMEERVRLVGGTFRLTSSPGEGTTVFARVPLPCQTNTTD